MGYYTVLIILYKVHVVLTFKSVVKLECASIQMKAVSRYFLFVLLINLNKLVETRLRSTATVSALDASVGLQWHKKLARFVSDYVQHVWHQSSDAKIIFLALS